MKTHKVTSKSLLVACRKLLAKDPITNILPLGDLYQPLFRVSDIYATVESHRVIGVCSIYRAYSKPSVVLSNSSTETKRVLIKKALSQVSDDFITLCTPEETDLFKERATILHRHDEHQMTTNKPKSIQHADTKPARVEKNELEQLNTFYAEHKAEAWTPIQFQAGPYYCIKRDSTIVSAAGIHITTPQIAQLGNIITDEAHRNRGFGTACTSTLAAHLASRGRIISLFVRVENAPAIHVYEKLGFTKTRDVRFLVMRKTSQSNAASPSLRKD
jgi:RimJ/RimL family protein N-acetyltransferase